MSQPTEPKYHEGDTVYIYGYGYNQNGLIEGTVIRVGRKLVQVESPPGHLRPYRIEDGVVNDGYGYSWIRTQAEKIDHEARVGAIETIRGYGLKFKYGLTARPTSELLALVKFVTENWER